MSAGSEIHCQRRSMYALEPSRLQLSPTSPLLTLGRIEIGGAMYLPGMRIEFAPPIVRGELGDPRLAGGLGHPNANRAATAGEVWDARDGTPLAGVRIRFGYSESEDGYPPLPIAGAFGEIQTEADGSFRLAPFRLTDPRLWVHLEFESEGYEPEVRVVGERRTSDGDWPFTRVELRRAETRELTAVDAAGAPLRWAAFRLAPSVPNGLETGEIALVSHAMRPSEPTVRYSGKDGTLVISHRAGAIELLEPVLYPARIDGSSELDCPYVPDCSDAGEFDACAIRAVPGPVERFRLLDQRGELLPDTLVEIELDGTPTMRLYSDDAGILEIAPWPYCPPREPSLRHPQRGTLRALSPLVLGAECAIQVPSADRDLKLPVRSGGRLTLRAVERDANGEPHPIAVARVSIAPEMIAAEMAADGTISFEGALPAPGASMDVAINGYLPVRLLVPFHPPGDDFLDLGDVAFDRALTLALHLVGGSELADAFGEVQIALDPPVRFTHFYSIAARAVVEVTALEIGKRYHYGVARVSGLECGGEFLLSQSLLDSGLVIDLTPQVGCVETTLAGQVSALRPEEMRGYEVIERYFVEGESEPIVFAPYPLAPDGVFGSRRWLKSPLNAEVFLFGPPNRVGYGTGRFDADSRSIEIGLIDIQEPRYAQFRFAVDGIGDVGLPEGLEVYAERHRNHQVARLFEGLNGELIVENLLAGRYVLRWGGSDQRLESYPFDVASRQHRTSDVILRSAQATETVALEFVNADGAPVVGAAVRGTKPTTAEEREPGRYFVEIDTSRANEFKVEATEFQSASVRLEAGHGPIGSYLLRRAATIRARMNASDGLPFEGEIAVSWIGADDIAAENGPPFEVHYEPNVRRISAGLLDDVRVPAGAGILLFTAAGSDARQERRVDLPEDRRSDLGLVALEEMQSISGHVLFPDGAPAAGATVGLVALGEAFRFPERAFRSEAIRYAVATDEVGGFRLRGMPREERVGLVLVAHLAGWTDAAVEVLDPGRDGYELELAPEAELRLHIGYRDEGTREGYEFRLLYAARSGPDTSVVDIGPISGARSRKSYRGITPGFYRATWGRSGATLETSLQSAEVLVAAGHQALLSLIIDEVLWKGEAEWNGRPLERGTVYAMSDPAAPRTMRSASVQDGKFEIALPGGTRVAWFSMVPERTPAIVPDLARGTALPRTRVELARDAGGATLEVAYEAFDLEIRLPDDLLREESGLLIEFPHYTWDGRRYATELRRQALAGSPFKLEQLAPGDFAFSIIEPGRWSRARTVRITEDTTFLFSK